MSEVCLLSHMHMLSPMLLVVFSASINNDMLLSINLLFNTFITIYAINFLNGVVLCLFSSTSFEVHFKGNYL
jgi:hypothetical protein